MDKHIIANLAETNAYLTKKIVELELKDIGFKPETIQPAAAAPKASAPTPSQSTWAQVAANAHQKTPTLTQPTQPTPKKTQPNRQEKTADP